MSNRTIAESARVTRGFWTDPACDEVLVEITCSVCLGDLDSSHMLRLSREIERVAGLPLTGWHFVEGQTTETGEVWTYRRD
jgi:hypothetical protein